MLFSSVAKMSDAFEVVSFKFNDDIAIEEQKNYMEKLSNIVAKFEGFKSRDYYYSEENGRWIDFVCWSDLALAKKASEQAMSMPEAGEVFSKIEEKSMIFSHYAHVGGVQAN